MRSHTTKAITTAIANDDDSTPSCRPTDTASATTVEEWDDGIPPEPTIFLGSHLFSLYLSFKGDTCRG